MPKGKQTCKILKEIRKQIAAENDIHLVVEECTYQGDCKGTCPKCEAEVRYLERELEKRQRMGKAAVIAGMAVGTMLTATSCDKIFPRPLEGDVPYIPDSTEMPSDSILSDTIPDDPFMLEGDVLAPEPDTAVSDIRKEEKKAQCPNIEMLEIVGDIEADDELNVYVAPSVEGEVEDSETDVWQIVEQMPGFPGGEAKLVEFISKNIQYPQTAREKGIQGRVFIGFIVEKDGSVSHVTNLRGVDSELDAEAIRVVESMPKWKPGMHNGEFVRVSYQIPIHFKLEDTQE